MHERREHEIARMARLKAHSWPRWNREQVEVYIQEDFCHLSGVWGAHFFGKPG